MSIKCLIDNTEHDSIESLHKYLRKFKIKQEMYYEEYFARRDLLTGEKILFKNYEQYFNTDFKDKNNLKKWLKLNPEKGKEWSIEWLKKRKEKKNLILSPTQVELRSLTCPSIHYYETIGGYNNICESIGLKSRFNYNSKPIFNRLPDSIVIIQDSREQTPLKLPYNIKIGKIDAGDYGLEEKYDKKIYVERKNLNDMVASLSSKQRKENSDAKFGVERLKAELERAKQNNSYIIMLVENNINDALSFNYLPQMRWTKTNPNHIFKNLRDLSHEFTNFQVLFVNGRKEASKILIKIFEASETVKNIDLQYLYECGGFEF